MPEPATALPPTWVLDTNIVLDWLLFRGEHGVAIGQQLAAGQATWLATDAMRTEFTQVLARPSLARWPAPDAEQVAHAWALATWCPDAPLHPRLRCRDADDQGFLDLALAQRADALLTQDKDLLSLRRRAAALGLTIVSPAEWLAKVWM